MKRRIARYPWIADNLIGIAFVFSALYWIIESVVHAYVFHDSGIVEQVLFPSAREIWIRSLTGFYLILSGALVQHIINKRKTVERSHAEAHAELKSVLDSASWISIIATDADGIIVVFNTGAERMLGYAAEEMIGKRTPEVFHLKSEVEAHGKELSREFGRPIEGFEVFVARPKVRGYEEREWTYIRKDGSHLTVNLVVTVVRDEAGEIIGRVGIAQDISERKRTREALMHSEELLRATVESTADGILVVNEKGEVTHSNARFAQMWNIPQELIAARDDNKLLEYVLGQLEEPQSCMSKFQEL